MAACHIIIVFSDRKRGFALKELFFGFGWILLYFVICASSALVIHVKTKLPDEPFRKLLHFILLGSLLVWVQVYTRWWVAALACIVFVAAVYPVLFLLERVKGYSEFVTERRAGELKSSLAQVFGMFALVIGICWGLLEDKMLVLASVYAWGIGDALAALAGKRFGVHKIAAAGGKKSWEGTAAMFAASFFSVLLVLVLRGGLPWWGYLVTSLVAAAVSAAAELFTRDGHDTVTCPLAAMAALIVLLSAIGGLK